MEDLFYMYMDSINSDNNFYALSSFGNVLICSDSISNPKTVTFPNGYNLDTNLAFKVVFVNGHNCVDDSTPMTLNGIPVVVNKFGTLIPLPIHEMDESGTTVYKSVMPNCVLEMYYTSNYDGNNNTAFVVIGNPVVLSSADYTIYADGYIDNHVVDVIERDKMNPITSNAVANSLSYFIEETLTGGEWIDGKPIYRKVVQTATFTTSSPYSVFIPDLDTLVDVRLKRNYDTTSSTWWIIGDGTTSSNNIIIKQSTDAISIEPQSSSITMNNFTGILEYTKKDPTP